MILVYQEKLQNLWKHVFWMSDLEEKVDTRGLWMLNIPQQEVFVFQLFSHVWLLVTPWTEACQAPLSVGFPRQESWSGLPLSSPRDLLAPGIRSLSPALTGRFFTAELPGKPNEKDSVSKKILPCKLSTLYFLRKQWLIWALHTLEMVNFNGYV